MSFILKENIMINLDIALLSAILGALIWLITLVYRVAVKITTIELRVSHIESSQTDIKDDVKTIEKHVFQK